MLWNVTSERGFLPTSNPLVSIPIHHFDNTTVVYSLENLIQNMPVFLSNRVFREELVSQMREVAEHYNWLSMDAIGGQLEYERSFFILSSFANAYVNASGESQAKRVPKEISIPLARSSFLVRRQSVLDYTSYCLYNWSKRHNGSIEPIQTFTETTEEKNLIVAFVELEQAVGGMLNCEDNFFEKATLVLQKAADSISDIARYADFKSYYRPFVEILYDGTDPTPKSHKINLFTQSPAIRWFSKKMGVAYKDQLLQEQEADIVKYCPAEHTNLINSTTSIRGGAKKPYRACLMSLSRIYQVVDDLGGIGADVRNEELSQFAF